jgi:tetratricopeptide (TPR) repeat protein
MLFSLSEHPHLAKLQFSSAVDSYEPWGSNDLLRHLKTNLEIDPHPLARIHEAAALFSLGFADRAREVLNSRKSAATLFAKAELLDLSGDLSASAECYRGLRLEFALTPETRVALLTRELRARVRSGQLDHVRKECTAFLESTEDNLFKIYLLDFLAAVPLSYDCPSFIPDALRWIDRAIQLAPHLAGLKATKGALLYENLDREHAREFLHRCLLEGPEEYASALCHLYLALLERKRGHMDEATTLARRAKAFSRDKWLVSAYARNSQFDLSTRRVSRLQELLFTGGSLNANFTRCNLHPEDCMMRGFTSIV